MKINCDFCLDFVEAEETRTDGRRTLCGACYSWMTIIDHSFIDPNFKPTQVQKCSICESDYIESTQDYSEWRGTSPHSLICETCMVQCTPEYSKNSIEGLRRILGDA